MMAHYEPLSVSILFTNKKYFHINIMGAGPHSGRAPDVSQRSCIRYPVWPHIFVSPSPDSRGAVVSYWGNYVHEVLKPLRRSKPAQEKCC